MNGAAYARRKLRNICLHLMMKANEQETIVLCQNQFINAITMTDKLASFRLLAHSKNDAIQKQAIDAFYLQWSKNELVINKWFSTQATSDVKNTLQVVRKLLQHPDFSYENPNKVRALVGA